MVTIWTINVTKNSATVHGEQEQCVEFNALHCMLSCLSGLPPQGEELHNVESILVAIITLIHGLHETQHTSS
jgi:hypothetical protein